MPAHGGVDVVLGLGVQAGAQPDRNGHIGIAAGPSVAIHDTFNRADHAMYAAKGAGGDQTRTASLGHRPDRHSASMRAAHGWMMACETASECDSAQAS